MKANRLGCMTPMAIMAAIITLLAIGGMAFVSGSGFFNAGSLNAQGSGTALGGVTSHAQIGDDCAKCHAAPWDPDTMGDRCVVCHADILTQLPFPNTLHGAIQSQVSKINCRSCHSEHKGPDAPLTDAHLSNFPHENMPFSLAAHQRKPDWGKFACADCHAQGFQPNSFEQSQCAACHTQMDPAFAQAHKIEYGDTCLACHDGLETIHQAFNHSSAAFQLTGKHESLRCGECHSGARSRADMAALPTACESCHAADDAHSGRYGLTCGECHNPAGWRDSLKFDHNLSTFKLEGMHVSVECQKCHTNPQKFAGIASDCASCHQKDDVHQGGFGTACGVCHNASGWKDVHIDHNLFAFKLDGQHVNVPCLTCHVNNTLKGTPSQCAACHAQDDAHNGQFGTDCALCHSTSAWKPSTFDHNRSSFKLTGAHTGVSCLSCHRNGVFKGTPQNCFSCHAQDDAHNGQFGTDCSQCHTTSAWKPSTFDHNRSSFKLTGAHAGAACSSCHRNGVFRGTPQDCFSCHAGKDAHNGQFGTQCAQCHTTSAWKPATFDHNRSSFKLTGAHAGASCSSCHRNGVFKGTPQDCFSCHAGNDAHKGQFGTQCSQCHSTNAWKPANFNHSQFFPLTGRHASVSCNGCHGGGRFAGTPQNCAGCHGEPAFHAGVFGNNCEKCHSTKNWNANYTGSHPKISDGDGGTGVNHGGQGCRSCHTQSLRDATCTACHSGKDGGDDD